MKVDLDKKGALNSMERTALHRLGKRSLEENAGVVLLQSEMGGRSTKCPKIAVIEVADPSPRTIRRGSSTMRRLAKTIAPDGKTKNKVLSSTL